jgi:hypothetical protein
MCEYQFSDVPVPNVLHMELLLWTYLSPIFINYVPDYTHNSIYILSADDLNIYRSRRNVDDELSRSDINSVQNRCLENCTKLTAA